VVLTTPPSKKFLVTEPQIRWSRFFKNCRATEKDEDCRWKCIFK